jgi:hypothetical protein
MIVRSSCFELAIGERYHTFEENSTKAVFPAVKKFFIPHPLNAFIVKKPVKDLNKKFTIC